MPVIRAATIPTARLHTHAITTHVGLCIHVSALLYQLRRGRRVAVLSRAVKGRAVILHMGERGEGRELVRMR